MTTSVEALVYSGTSNVTPATGTLTITKADGTAVVDAQSPTNGVYSVASAATTSESAASDWLAVWSYSISSTTVRAPNRVIATKYVLRNPVSNASLLVRQPTWNVYPTGQTSHQNTLDAVWGDTLNRLLDEGRQPHRIRNPYGLAPFVTFESLARIADQRAPYVQDQDVMKEWADRYRGMAEKAWAAMRLDTDDDDDGDVDTTQQPADGVIYTSDTPPWAWGWR